VADAADAIVAADAPHPEMPAAAATNSIRTRSEPPVDRVVTGRL
jgi:hypothetical protein